MSYSLNLITLPSEADSLIKTAEREKRNLEHRKDSYQLRNENSAEDAVENAADLTSANAALTAVNAIIATLPEGERKEEELIKKMELELKIKKLTRNGSKRGAIATIEREYDAELIDRQLAAINDFISAVNARKAQL